MRTGYGSGNFCRIGYYLFDPCPRQVIIGFAGLERRLERRHLTGPPRKSSPEDAQRGAHMPKQRQNARAEMRRRIMATARVAAGDGAELKTGTKPRPEKKVAAAKSGGKQ